MSLFSFFRRQKPAASQTAENPTKKTAAKSAKASFFFQKKPRDLRKKPMLIHGFWLLFYFLVFCGIVTASAVVIYGFSLYQQYQLDKEDMTSAIWQLPSKVYARALDLYPDKALTEQDLIDELILLKYQQAPGINAPGTYLVTDNIVQIHTRGFLFADGAEPSQSLALQFSKNKLSKITELSQQQPLNLARLEPLQIGSIYPKSKEDRLLIKLSDVPPFFIDGLLAAEDRRFYSHFGVDIKGILRAVYQYARSGGSEHQGGSTLTQQFVKNHYLSNERSLSRKIKEAIIAIILESKFDKNTILEGYLNEIYLGQDGDRAIHGFGLASDFYFNKPLAKLEPHQIALLLALVNEPSRANPYRNPSEALKRRNFMLTQFAQQNLISLGEANLAKSLPLDVATKRNRSEKDKYYTFLSVVHKQLSKEYDLEQLGSGLNIFTTLDPILQNRTEKVIEQALPRLERSKGLRKNFLQTAVVIVEPNSAEVLTLIGDRNPETRGFNRATQAKRQPGSLIKPAVYLAALEHPMRYNLASKMDDSPLEVARTGEVWRPKNYDRKNLGSLILVDSLAKSRNIPTARIGLDLGLDDISNTIARLGGPRVPPYPSIVLGTEEMTPFEVAEMYETFASGGYHMPLRVIRVITDNYGESVVRYPMESTKAIEELPYYLITYAMQEVVRRGTATGLKRKISRNLNIAGKTGTTDDYRDSWFAGFSSNFLSVVWVGNDDNKITKLSGTTGALQIWMDVMAPLPLQENQLTRPEEIIEISVDKSTGSLISQSCRGIRAKITLPFIRGSQPKTYNNCEPKPVKNDWLDTFQGDGENDSKGGGGENDSEGGDVFELNTRH